MYIGNSPTDGENNSFKLIDSLASVTKTFDGSSASVVSTIDDSIVINNHPFVTGQRVTYTTTGTAIGNLISGTAYYIIKYDQNTIKLALNYTNAINNVVLNLTGLGTGTDHNLNVAFDGINTKFVVTYDNGTKAQFTRAAQLQISINGVIQQPQDTTSPTNGFGIDLNSVIIFSTPPAVSDVFWGNLIANNFPTFDIADNTVDSFTGNGSQTDFTLSKTPANNQNVLVTIDGVVQYPSDATTVRAYSLYGNVLSFVGVPGNGTAIQVRHIGFAGATSSAVTGFYGRTGNVVLTNQDNITVGTISSIGNINSSGIGTFASLVVTGNVSVAGTITSEDVVNIDSIGIITARSGINVISGGINTTGAAVSMGNVMAGIITASKFVGDGSLLTGVVSSKWRQNTAGITTESSVGVNTTSVDVAGLTGVGNSFNGMYVSNGMIIYDNVLNGNHYIGTNFNGLMAGPVTINGTLTVDGNYVVV
ncbi:tail fiber protein [Synechococcus phage S-SRM01]|uniref:Baseplate wedge initiator n=1 Tax=Synechococcus phage S-SRM01 TaxID=2781608 RepID=A0A879R2Y3_9CAUD|nr:tail fiber protein [Synechococcus phage S-SRM01]QPX47966.1 baseplate wedge initiator [Synechococcus phage S-SRM01]